MKTSIPTQASAKTVDNVIPSNTARHYGIRMGIHPCVYILASKRNGTLYTGVTGNLSQRVWQHKTGTIPGFTKNYGVAMLVYAEPHETMNSAITHEKQIKEWKRNWKIELITETNPDWRDLYDELCR